MPTHPVTKRPESALTHAYRVPSGMFSISATSAVVINRSPLAGWSALGVGCPRASARDHAVPGADRLRRPGSTSPVGMLC
jgi:hypothetical protein